MKRVLIIGGGVNQLPLITAAKAENYFVVVCDGDDNAPGVQFADEFFCVSTKDRNALLKVAKEKNVDGVVANSEYAMRDVAFITKELKLIGNDEDAISTFMSKKAFRILQQNSGVYAPLSKEFHTYEEFFECVTEFKFPIIIKPSESSGTRGTTKFTSFMEKDGFKQAFNTCKEISRNSLVTVEEYVEMSTTSVIEGEVFINNGELLWDGLFETIRSKDNLMIPMTYVFPLSIENCKLNSVKKTLEILFEEAKIKHGEYNVELYFTEDDDVFVIEINARQGGNSLPQYVCKHSGIDLYKLLITTSVGDNYYWDYIKTFERSNRYIIHHMLYPRRNGEFKELFIDESIKNNIIRVELHAEKGDYLQSTIDASSEIGFVDLEFEHIEEQQQISKRIEDVIKIMICERSV